MSSEPLLIIDNVSVNYGAVRGLVDVSLEVPESGFVAVLGPNGAGKSTLVRSITGLLEHHDAKVKSGSIIFDGADITGKPSADVVPMGIAQVPEGRMLFAHLTVNENLLLGASTRTDRSGVADDLEKMYEMFPALTDRRKERAGFLSGGEQQMVAIGRALIANPRLLICDELSLGLAPQLVAQLFETLTRLNKDHGTAILAIEQNARMALSHADYGYLLESGEVTLSGPADELRSSDEIVNRYLGGASSGGRTTSDDPAASEVN